MNTRESIWTSQQKRFINPLLTKSDLQILLCLTPDDFTCQREAPQAVKG